MKKRLTTLLLSCSLLASGPALARDLTFTLTNLTNATYFTPLLVAAHNRGAHLFQVGETASLGLQAVAEGGDTSLLINDLLSSHADFSSDPAQGLLGPGVSVTAELEIENKRNRFLSLVAMLLPTNDGFVGLDALTIPKKAGVYTYYLNAYDAGTEANDEIVNGGGALGVPGIPADPGGNAGSGAVAAVGPDHNDKVHVHRGVLGDDDPIGGGSDLNRAIHRFDSPVAKLTIKVGRSEKERD